MNDGQEARDSAPASPSDSADAPSAPILRIPLEVASRLGYYVYLYVDPRTGRPFYVGKGKGQRVLSHLTDPTESTKTGTIRELLSLGTAPRLEILAHGIEDEETAFRIEAAVIDLLGIGALTNKVSGWKSLELGRMSLEELMGYYAAPPSTVTVPALLIRINRLYRHGMSAHELYEATRGIWKVGPRREGVRHAFAVFEGVVREVFEIERWDPALTTPYDTRELTREQGEGRWEFIGHRATEDVRATYVNRSVKEYFKHGQQSPMTYVNC